MRTSHSSAAPRQGPESRAAARLPFPPTNGPRRLRVRGSSGSSGVGGGQAGGRTLLLTAPRTGEGWVSLPSTTAFSRGPGPPPRSSVVCSERSRLDQQSARPRPPRPSHTHTRTLHFLRNPRRRCQRDHCFANTEARTKESCLHTQGHTHSQRTGIRTAVPPAAHPSPACSTPLHSGPGPAATVPTALLSPAW